ncbi:10713_t:CDS:2, partial [Paraglomus occultum]
VVEYVCILLHHTVDSLQQMMQACFDLADPISIWVRTFYCISMPQKNTNNNFLHQ